MFLMFLTGTPLLPAGDGRIEMTFFERFLDTDIDTRGDPEQNPSRWPDHTCPIKQHRCFAGADLPLIGVSKLLEQPIPDDTTSSTDFDLYQYMMFRPTTRYAEFGGMLNWQDTHTLVR
ncbi:hypothetical protein B0H10DRAFT_2446061, partial [Mycena sp. CBHHK59/15]